MISILAYACALSSIGKVLAQSSISLSVSTTAPSGVSPTVDPTFPGFAFEERSFYYYAGPGGQPNTFSVNLFNAVANRTNTKPSIRAGGSSLNSAKYDPSQTEGVIVPPKVSGHAIPLGMSMGPSFFDAFNNVDGTFTLDMPMTQGTDLDSTVAFAKQAYSTIGGDNIDIFELGNEVNSYGKSYTPSDYSTQFDNFSSAISQALGLSTDDQRWTVGSLANGVGPAWNTTLMFTAGLDDQKSRIRSFSVHYYQTEDRTPNVQNELMNHGNVVSKMEQFKSEIAYTASMNINFDIAEVGCGPGSMSGSDTSGERTLGSALWQVDWMMYVMSMGVHRVNMQSGLGFDFSLWAGIDFTTGAGVDRPQAVYANYYAQVFVADFIGTSGKMQVLNVDLSNDQASAYAAYEDGKLARVALVNLNYWDNSTSSTRQNSTFSVNVGNSIGQATVQRLSSASGAMEMDSESISWAGQSWSTKSNGVAYSAATDDTSTAKVDSGVLNIDVADSEAVMLLFSQSSSTSSSSSSSSSTSTASSASSTTASGNGATTTSGSISPTGSATQSAGTAGSTPAGKSSASTVSSGLLSVMAVVVGVIAVVLAS